MPAPYLENSGCFRCCTSADQQHVLCSSSIRSRAVTFCSAGEVWRWWSVGRVVGGHVAKWSMSMGVYDVAEQRKGTEAGSLLVSQIHLALLSFKLEINRFKTGGLVLLLAQNHSTADSLTVAVSSNLLCTALQSYYCHLKLE